jgi:hypothetical protein
MIRNIYFPLNEVVVEIWSSSLGRYVRTMVRVFESAGNKVKSSVAQTLMQLIAEGAEEGTASFPLLDTLSAKDVFADEDCLCTNCRIWWSNKKSSYR